MKTTLYKGFVLVFAISLVLQSCTKDFDKINSDPNNPALEQAVPKMLLPNAIESMTSRVYEIFLGHEMGNCWVQHMAKVQYTDEDRYIPRVAVINNTWSSFYASNGMDVSLLLKISKAQGLDNYQGVSLVLQAYITSVLTDLFGPVPFKDAWKGSSDGILSPAYDNQESIYRALIANLDTANTLLASGTDDLEGDILYGDKDYVGDAAKWRKFANSLRMRLILRMSDQDATFATTELTAMMADPTKYPILSTNADNAQLVYLGSSPNNNPINENRITRDDHRVSKTVTDLMWTKASYVDWRILLYAELDGNSDFEGMPNGLTSTKAAAYNGNGLANTSKLGAYFTAATSPGVLMSVSEIDFLLAEAAHKGYIGGGDVDAQTYYEKGIHDSYAQWGPELEALAVKYNASFGIGGMTADELAQDFYDNDDYAWDAANAMELIGTQKWVAMFDQGLQSWFEWRRIGYPVLVPAVDGAEPQVPVRVFYPSDEGARNPTNLAAGVALLGGPDKLSTRVWWDTQDNY